MYTLLYGLRERAKQEIRGNGLVFNCYSARYACHRDTHIMISKVEAIALNTSQRHEYKTVHSGNSGTSID